MTAKGAGYGLATQQMEAYLYLLSMRNGFEAGGNTSYGKFLLCPGRSMERLQIVETISTIPKGVQAPLMVS